MVGYLADEFEHHMLEYLPNRNFTLTRRFPEPINVAAAIRGLLTEIDILVIWTTYGSIAAKKYATGIPVVFLAVGAPVGIGLVQSLNSPGGNMTGVSFEAATDTYAKRLQILTEVVPNLKKVAVLKTIGDPNVTFAMVSVTKAAPDLNVELKHIDIKTASDLPHAFDEMKSVGAQALLVVSSSVTYAASKQIAELTLTYNMPSCSPFREQALAGGLVSLGPDLKVMARQGADLVYKIINGAKPNELPVEQPSRYEMFMNLKAARKFGITLPMALLGRADKLIE